MKVFKDHGCLIILLTHMLLKMLQKNSIISKPLGKHNLLSFQRNVCHDIFKCTWYANIFTGTSSISAFNMVILIFLKTIGF